jgi:arylformamidase
MPFTLDSIKDLDAVMRRRALAAERASALYACERAVPYGPDEDHTLDLYRPPGVTGPVPVLMFIHGGFWRSLRAAQFSFLAPAFVDHGVALAVIDYPLIPRVRMQEVVQACRLALVHLHRQADALGLDRARIAVAGNSAGGHLVAELMDTAWMAGMDFPEDGLCGGVAISGLFDLAPVAQSFQNDSLQLSAEEIARYSPLKRSLSLRVALAGGGRGPETSEFLAAERRFRAACGQLRGRCAASGSRAGPSHHGGARRAGQAERTPEPGRTRSAAPGVKHLTLPPRTNTHEGSEAHSLCSSACMLIYGGFCARLCLRWPTPVFH